MKRNKHKKVIESVSLAIDGRVYNDIPKDCRIVVGYVVWDTTPPDNVNFFYRKADDSFYLRSGPYHTGHWGHDGWGDVIPRARFLSDEYWQTVKLPDVAVRAIHAFLLKEGFIEKPPPYTKDAWLAAHIGAARK